AMVEVRRHVPPRYRAPPEHPRFALGVRHPAQDKVPVLVDDAVREVAPPAAVPRFRSPQADEPGPAPLERVRLGLTARTAPRPLRLQVYAFLVLVDAEPHAAPLEPQHQQRAAPLFGHPLPSFPGHRQSTFLRATLPRTGSGRAPRPARGATPRRS